MDLHSLYDRLAEFPQREARFVSRDGTLEVKTFSELRASVDLLKSRLLACGVSAGDLVGLMGPNSYSWVVADLALLALGCVSVAIPVEGAKAEFDTREIAERYDLSALFVSREVKVRGGLSPESALLEDPQPSLVKRRPRRAPRLPADVFTICFSSGSAGTKKGLMVSRSGVENAVQTAIDAWGLGSADEILIVMPFSALQQRELVYAAIWVGGGAIIVPPERMFQKMAELGPTIVLGPPSFFEIVASRVGASRGRARVPYRVASALHTLLPGLSRPLRARLGRRWTGLYGSRIRLMLVGSAPVPPRLVEIFHRLGSPLYEIYGMTEVGWITFNLPGRSRTGTSGTPAEGVAVEIAADETIVARSAAPQAVGYVFEGTESRDSVFLADGAISTGDLGALDEAGFLRLLGRKGNVIVTPSGVKINPEELEREIEQQCPVDRAVVIAGPGASLSCVVWLDDDDLDRRHRIQEMVAQVNKRREPARWIADVVFREAEELTAESGLLTRNLKIDRAAVKRTVLTGDRVA